MAAGNPEQEITVKRGYVDELRRGWIVLFVVAFIAAATLVVSPVVASGIAVGIGAAGLVVLAGLGLLTLR